MADLTAIGYDATAEINKECTASERRGNGNRHTGRM